ncbi:hypothetical protein BJ165DRAFT_1448969 [Panaeolus papilionaceus]|nr:hypothetical protein BJ165DRAFT_1448969 [Panaeolus papilionaceus]
MTFYFDRVIYTPTNTSDFDASSWHLFEANHPSVSYESGWSNFRDIGNYTTTNGGSVTISYFGKSVIFAGAVPGDFSVTPTTAQYAVDDGKPTTFRLAGLPSSRSMEQYNQAFFQTPLLPQAQHTLKVSYGGNNSTTPLTLNFFMIQHDPILTNGRGGGGAGNNTSNNSDGKQDTAHEKSTIGIAGIVGAVVGGIVLVGLLVTLVLWLRCHFWRRRRRAQYLSLDIDDETLGPFDPFVDREWDPSTSLHRPSISSAQLATSYPMAPTITGTTSLSRGTNEASATNQDSFMSSGSGWYSNGRPSVFSVTNGDTTLSPLECSYPSLAYPPEKKNKYIESTTPPLTGTSSTKVQSSAEHGPIVVHHEDSGIRLGPQPREEQEVIDVPPTYTPG